jgi:hypothetical protein
MGHACCQARGDAALSAKAWHAVGTGVYTRCTAQQLAGMELSSHPLRTLYIRSCSSQCAG